MVTRQNIWQDTSLIVAGEPYQLDDTPGSDPPHTKQAVPVQPGEMGTEFEVRLENLALGWGMTKETEKGGYDYGNTAVLHKRLSWLPGAKVTDRTAATAPDGPVSFCEFWDGTAANRRLLCIASRYVFEVRPNGTVDVNDLTASVAAGKKMTKGIRYKAPTAMASPKMFIAVQGGSTDYFIVRSAANTYAVNAGSKVAKAFAVAKDIDGEDIVARIDENGKVNFTTADTDPDAGASWAAAVYAVGETSVGVNDLFQQGRSLLVGREDGAFTFDNVANSIPVTKGMEQTPSADAFRYWKDFNGLALAPSAQGLIYVDGLDWGVCGPVSSNLEARNLRGTEVAVSAQAGIYDYCAVYSGGTSYIFVGTPRANEERGTGPFVWHGPVASVSGQVSDLCPSTVFGTKLWIGTASKIYTIDLNSDYSPVTDAASGYIYLPEGSLDVDGPGVIKDFRKAEFIAPAGTPFASTNQWTIGIETTPGSGTYVDIDGGTVSSGVYAERFWSTETSGRRLRARLAYSGNTGSAELETVIVRGTQRPETTDEHHFRIIARDGGRKPGGARNWQTAEAIETTLRALLDSGRATAITYGQETFTGKVTDFKEVPIRVGRRPAPHRMFSLVIRKVKVA